MIGLAAPVAALVQGQPLASSPWALVADATVTTKLILSVLAAFSLISWVQIAWKWKEFHGLRGSGDTFVEGIRRAAGLRDLYHVLQNLEDSPYTRVFRGGINFFTELRPSALRVPEEPTQGLSSAQLDAMRLVLEKELSQERDDLGHGLAWLAIIGSVSPLLGLMGTVVGVMDAFFGIAAQGSANIAAVAPGIAEALITTVAGLSVAIPAVIAYNHFASKLSLFTSELEGFANELIGTLAREGRI